MKNTAVLLCSNIVLQEGEKNSFVQNNSPGSTTTKNNMRLRFEKGNKLSADKSYN